MVHFRENGCQTARSAPKIVVCKWHVLKADAEGKTAVELIAWFLFLAPFFLVAFASDDESQ